MYLDVRTYKHVVATVSRGQNMLVVTTQRNYTHKSKCNFWSVLINFAHLFISRNYFGMLKIYVLWTKTPCLLVNIHRCFGGNSCLHLQGLDSSRRVNSPEYKYEGIPSTEKSSTDGQQTLRHAPNELDPQPLDCEQPVPRTFAAVSRNTPNLLNLRVCTLSLEFSYVERNFQETACCKVSIRYR